MVRPIMKNIIALFIFPFPLLIFAQDVKMEKPNVSKLKAEMKRTNFAENVIYMFLNGN
jgi:hypothetical protein